MEVLQLQTLYRSYSYIHYSDQLWETLKLHTLTIRYGSLTVIESNDLLLNSYSYRHYNDLPWKSYSYRHCNDPFIEVLQLGL